METVVNGKQEAAAAGASQPSLLVRRLETAISVLLVGVALAAPAWTKAAVLLCRLALLLWLLRMLTPPRPRLRPLAIGVYIQQDKMLIRWERSTNIHRVETIQALADRSVEVLRWLVAHGHR